MIISTPSPPLVQKTRRLWHHVHPNVSHGYYHHRFVKLLEVQVTPKRVKFSQLLCINFHYHHQRRAFVCKVRCVYPKPTEIFIINLKSPNGWKWCIHGGFYASCWFCVWMIHSEGEGSRLRVRFHHHHQWRIFMCKVVHVLKTQHCVPHSYIWGL